MWEQLKVQRSGCGLGLPSPNIYNFGFNSHLSLILATVATLSKSIFSPLLQHTYRDLASSGVARASPIQSH